MNKSRLLMKNLSIKQKLFLTIGIIILVVEFFIAFYFPSKQAANMMHEESTKLQIEGSIIATAVSAALEYNDPQEISKMSELIEADPDFSFMILKDQQGEIVYQKGRIPKNIYIPEEFEKAQKKDDFLYLRNQVKSAKGSVLGELLIAFSLKRINSTLNDYRIAALFVGILILFIGVGAILTVSRGILRPIKEATYPLIEISRGNLTLDIREDTTKEFSDFYDSYKTMLESLRNLLSQIKDTSNKVAKTALKVSLSSEKLNESASKQAKATDETGSSMEEMGYSIQSVSNNAKELAGSVAEISTALEEMGVMSHKVSENSETMASNVYETSAAIEEMVVTIDRVKEFIAGANGLSQKASKEAKSGDEAIMQTLSGMKNIEEVMTRISEAIESLGRRSQAIGGIVEIIEDIADQTNLLALNAAIEAARAGDVGRGFTVVADEIRKLAERSIKATKEISSVIKEVQSETQSTVDLSIEGNKTSQKGLILADKAGKAIKEIIRSVDSASNIMDEVTATTVEQSKSAKTVISSVEKMNDLTKHVANSVKEQAEGINSIVKTMTRMIDMTEQIKTATAEQKNRGDYVIKSAENIKEVAKSNLEIANELSLSIQDMSQQSQSLQGLSKSFKLET